MCVSPPPDSCSAVLRLLHDDESGGDKHALSVSNLSLLKRVLESGERPDCLEEDFSLVVGRNRFLLESSGVRVDSPGDSSTASNAATLQHVQLSALGSVSANLSLLVFWINKEELSRFSRTKIQVKLS